MADEDLEKIIDIVCTEGNAPKRIGPDDDFLAAGVSSFAMLNIRNALEDAFSVSIEGHDDEFIDLRTARGVHALVQRLK